MIPGYSSAAKKTLTGVDTALCSSSAPADHQAAASMRSATGVAPGGARRRQTTATMATLRRTVRARTRVAALRDRRRSRRLGRRVACDEGERLDRHVEDLPRGRQPHPEVP